MYLIVNTAQKMKFCIKVFFSKCDQIRSLLPIWLHLLKKFLMENFIFCAVLKVILISIFNVNSSDDFNFQHRQYWYHHSNFVWIYIKPRECARIKFYQHVDNLLVPLFNKEMIITSDIVFKQIRSRVLDVKLQSNKNIYSHRGIVVSLLSFQF